jgi:hypothetical protein
LKNLRHEHAVQLEWYVRFALWRSLGVQLGQMINAGGVAFPYAREIGGKRQRHLGKKHHSPATLSCTFLSFCILLLGMDEVFLEHVILRQGTINVIVDGLLLS